MHKRSHTHTHTHGHTYNFQQLSRNRDMQTSAEDVLRDTVARLEFPSWDTLWLAHMLILGDFSYLPFSLHKTICFMWASNRAFHHLLALKLVLVTKEGFWQSAKTDCHKVFRFQKAPRPTRLLPLTEGPLISSRLRKLSVKKALRMI